MIFYQVHYIFTFDISNDIDSMHELSLAIQIVEMAEEEAKKAGSNKIMEIELEVGTLAGADIEALTFAMDSAVIGSFAENARVQISQIPALAQCNNCQETFPVEDLFTVCPGCHSYDTRLIRGSELRLKSLMVD